MKHTITKYGLIVITLLALLLQGCGQQNQDNTATISVRLSDNAVDQMSESLSSREVIGKPSGINRIIITVKKLANGEVIASGDILQSGNQLTFTVPAHVAMLLTGDGYDAVNGLQFQGETEIPALRPGETASPSLSLEDITVPTGTRLTVVVPSLSVGTSSNIQLIELGSNGDEQVGVAPIAQATFGDEVEGVFTITLPDGIAPDSKYIFRVIDDPSGDPPAQVDARYTNVNVANNTLTINEKTHAVSNIITGLTRNGNVQNVSSEITLEEISEVDKIVADIDRFLDKTNIGTVEQYRSIVLTQINSNLEHRNVVSSIVAKGQICGNVREVDPEISSLLLPNIRIQVRDFDNRLLRARAFTDANGHYCVNVPTQNELNALAGLVDTKGEYIVGAMNYTDTSAAGSAWWVNVNNTTPMRIDAEKIILSDPTIGIEFAEVTNPPSVDFVLSPGVRVTGTVTGRSEGPIPLADIIVTLRDSKTHFIAASAKTASNGDYVINAPPGDYIIEALNTTPITAPINVRQPYATATYIDANTVSNNRNFGTIVSLQVGVISGPYDISLPPGVMVTGSVTEPNEGPPIPVTGVRVVFNLLSGTTGNGPATRFKIKNTDGSYGVWMQQDSYKVYAYGQNSDADLRTTAQGESFAVPEFAAQVATLPINVNALVSGQNIKLSQIKFELFEKTSGADAILIHTNFSRSDGSLTLYSQIQSDHIVIGRLDQARSAERPYASTVYGGPNIGFTQRDIGFRIPLTPGVTEPVLQFNPLLVGGTLTGTVLDTGGQPMPNMRVTVRHQVSNNTIDRRTPRFVTSRTRSDGTYTLSLPQATYTSIVFSDTSGADVGNTTCPFVPVFSNVTTTLDVEFDIGETGCTPSAIPSLYIRVGNAHFDPTTSADLTQHPLFTPLMDWNMSAVNLNDPPLYYFFAVQAPVTERVPVTNRSRELDFGEGGIEIVTDDLAIDIGGSLYSLGSGAGVAPIDYTNPVLLIPGELTAGVMWNITDGNLLTPALIKQGEIVSLGLNSTGDLATDYVHVSYTQDVVAPAIPIVENFYFLKGDGLQEEIVVTDPGSPSAIPPIPSTETIWRRNKPVILP